VYNRFKLALTFSAQFLAVSIAWAQPNTNPSPTVLPIFDAHLHYSHDAVELIPPDKAVALLRAAGLKYAVVSSSNDEGTQKLRALAPDLVLPSLRPYRSRADTSSWLSTDAVVPYMKERLAKYRYVAIGEFHVYGEQARTPIMKATVELAKQYQLILHSHSDAKAIDILFELDPTATIVWAHSGFDSPESIAPMLKKYPRLYADLAFRSDYASGGDLDPAWRKLFEQFPDRFLAGTDTFTPERWSYVGEYANWMRSWLNKLPSPLREKLAYANGEALFKPFQDRMLQKERAAQKEPLTKAQVDCKPSDGWQSVLATNGQTIYVKPNAPMVLGKLFTVDISTCNAAPLQVKALDVVMPAHRHGMNYKPSFASQSQATVRASGLLLHMQGQWQWQIDASINQESVVRFTAPFVLQ
jgi:hypothetical protein